MSDDSQTQPNLLVWGGALIGAVLLAVLMAFFGTDGSPTAPGAGAASRSGDGPLDAVEGEVGSREDDRLKGVVRDAESRAGIAGAAVTLQRGGETRSATTDGGGRFEVELSGGGAWTVRAEAPGYEDAVKEPVVVTVGPGATAQVLLVQRGVVAGKVVHQGEPVAGAEVNLLRLAGDGGEPEVMASGVQSDAAGRFELSALPGRVRVLAESPGFALAESREIQVRGGARVDGLVLDLTPRGTLVVEVVSEEGAPVKQARVEVMGVATWQVPAPLTDDAGRAELKEVPAGTPRLRVTALGYSIVETEPIPLAANEVVQRTIALPALQGVSGRVVDARGQPVRGASVVLKPALSPTSSNRVNTHHGGQFRFDGLDVGAYLLSASHPRHGPSGEVRVNSSEKEPVVLELSEGGAIAGRVVDGSRSPAPSFTVVVERFVPDVQPSFGEVELGSRHFGARPFADPEGRFNLDGLGPGVYDLYVDGGDLGSGRAEGVTVSAGRTTSRVEVELEGGSLVTGRVVDARSGEPIAGAEVAIADGHRRRRGLEPRAVVTDGGGNFAFQGVAEGRRSLRVRKEGYTSRIRAGLELGRGDVRDLEIALVPRAEGEEGQVEFFGIGAVLQTTPEGHVRIQSTLEGGPGSQFGLKANDTILRVDGEDVSSLGLGRTVELIRGEEGTAVTLEVQREGEPYPFEVGIDRGRVVFEEKGRERKGGADEPRQ